MRYLLPILLLPTLAFGATPTVGTTSYNETATATDTMRVIAPAGLGSGDLCLVFCMSDQNNPGSGEHDETATNLTFMGQIASNAVDVNLSAHYWKGGTPPDSFKVEVDPAGGGSGRYMMWAIEVLNPHATPEEFTTAGVTSTITSLSVTGATTTNDSVLAFVVAAFDGPDGGPVSGFSGTGWTQQAEDEVGNAGNGLAGIWGTNPVEDNGATFTVSITWAATDGSVGLQVGIRGADPGGAADQYEGTVIIIQ